MLKLIDLVKELQGNCNQDEIILNLRYDIAKGKR